MLVVVVGGNGGGVLLNIPPGDVPAAASGRILSIERLENSFVSLFRCSVINPLDV